MQTLNHGGLRTEIPLPPLKAGRLEFGLDDLHDLRAQVAATATAVGLAPSRVSDLVVAASELGANSVLHGGGRGLATIWGDHGSVFVEVADGGTITDQNVGQRRPDPTAESGRGLYIANQLCDTMAIESGASGTRVRLQISVAPGDA